MAQSILVFDFGANEEAAQQARHKIEGWKQGFRLGNKILIKFEREHAAPGADGESTQAAKQPAAEKGSSKKKSKATHKGPPPAGGMKKQDENLNSRVRVLVRLDFSDHEKLSYQRWLDRIPGEEPFKSAQAETIRNGDAAFAKTLDLFDSLS